MTADERALLERKMREAGTTNMGAYLRKMALDGYILRLDLPELKEILSQLRYMGNNVNQIAKRANEVGVIDEMDIRGVSKRQERMLEQIARLLEKLSGLNWKRGRSAETPAASPAFFFVGRHPCQTNEDEVYITHKGVRMI